MSASSTTLTSATPGVIVGESIVAETLSMGSKTITSITDNPAITDPSALLTAAGVNQAIAAVIVQFTASLQAVNAESLIVTSNLIAPGFTPVSLAPTTGLLLVGWTTNGTSAVLSNTPPVGLVLGNQIIIPPGRYPIPSYYLFSFTITAISGFLSLNFNNTVLDTLTQIGSYTYLIDVQNITTASLILSGQGVVAGQSIVLSNAALIGIATTLYEFITYGVTQAISQLNASGTITTAELTQAITAAMNAHLAVINPHHITPALIGAAQVVHYHPQYALIADLSIPTVTGGELIAAVTTAISRDLPGAALLQTPVSLLTKTLTHMSTSSYDGLSGMVMASGTLLAPLVNAVSANLALGARYTLFALVPNMLPSLRYQLARPRVITDVTLISKNTAGVASVVQALIIAGGQTIPLIVTPTAGSVTFTTVNFNAVLATDIVVTVESVTDPTQNAVALGLDILYGDTSAGMLAIAPDVTAALTYQGRYLTLTPGQSLVAPLPSPIPNHPYWITLTTPDGLTAQAGILAIPPQIGPNAQPWICALRQITSNSDGFYGTVTVAGVSNPNAAYLIYTTPGGVIVNSDTVTVTQSFLTPLALDHLDIWLAHGPVAPNAYPQTITLVVTQADGTSVTQTFTPQYFTNELLTGEMIISMDLSLYGVIAAFTLTMISAAGSICAVALVDVAVSCLAYDTLQHLWSDNTARALIGRVRYMANYLYAITPFPLGYRTVVPVNDLLPLTFYQTYTLDNPFQTEHVDVITLAPDGSVTSFLGVVQITALQITLLAQEAGQICLIQITCHAR